MKKIQALVISHKHPSESVYAQVEKFHEVNPSLARTLKDLSAYLVQETPAIILLEDQMVLNVEVFKLLQAQCLGKHVMIILVSEVVSPGVISTFRKHFETHFILQPARRQDLEAYIYSMSQVNNRLERELEETKVLLSISEVIAKTRDRKDLYHVIGEKLTKIFDFSDLVIVLCDREMDRHIYLIDYPFRNRDHENFSLLFGEWKKTAGSRIEWMLSQPGPMVKKTTEMAAIFPDDPGIKMVMDVGIKEYLITHLVTEDRVVGVTFLCSEKENVYDESMFALFQCAANQLAVAVSNILANEEVINANTKLWRERQYLKEEIEGDYHFQDIIGSSRSIRCVFDKVEEVGPTQSTVLVTGETGTGKELVARAIHNISDRREHPLVKLNCAALPANIIESELFGHEKGAFTGAVNKRIGKFELADKGTIFLDEIGELPLELQAKLLRVLQEQEFERLGSNETVKVDIRVIAATNRDLKREIAAGNFRSDLYYRLNVYPIYIPPLRERLEDIPELAYHFLKRNNKRIGKRIKKIKKASLDKLQLYTWPGNVRELEHVIERAVISCTEDTLVINQDINRTHINTQQVSEEFVQKTIRQNEIDLIVKTLDRTAGKIRGENGAARLLDINPNTLESRLKKLGIEKQWKLKKD